MNKKPRQGPASAGASLCLDRDTSPTNRGTSVGKTPEQKHHEKVAKIGSKHSLPAGALVAPGYGCWAAYFDGVIMAKSNPGFKPEAVHLQDVADLNLKSPNLLTNGSLKITMAANGSKPRIIIFAFLKDDELGFTHFKDVLEAERRRGVTGELPPEYQVAVKEGPFPEPAGDLEQAANPTPFLGISDEKFRAKYKIPADAILARSPGIGYVAFDGHFVTIQHIGIQRGVIGKGNKRFPITGITNIHMKPAGWVMSGYLQITAGGTNETKSKFGKQTWDASSDENTVVFGLDNEQGFLAVRDAIEAAQRNLHTPKPAAVQEDVMGQLAKLGGLRDAGILTDAEFDAKKAELLDRI